jgi:hypothetical protein
MGVEVISEISWKLTDDGKSKLVISGLRVEQIVFICEQIKLDVMTGKLVLQEQQEQEEG